MDIHKACKAIVGLGNKVEGFIDYLVAYECVLSILKAIPTGCTKDDLKKATHTLDRLHNNEVDNILLDLINEGHAKKVGDKYLFIEDFGQVFGGDK